MTFGMPAPGASEEFTEVNITFAAVDVWYHVYCTKTYATRPDSFNEGWGDTRFAPIYQSDGKPVHTYYAASTAECAFMESVLHDIPLEPAGQFDVDELVHFRIVELKLPATLNCVSFHTPYLPKLKLNRSQLIDSLPVHYPETRAWAQAAYQQRPDAQAIAYGSRRDDAARCVMLFEQRLPNPPFQILRDEPIAFSPRRAEILKLIRRLGIHEI